MTTITVPLSPELAQIVENFVARGIASNKADAIRRALIHFAEEQAVLDVLASQKEAREGKVFQGDLYELAKELMP